MGNINQVEVLISEIILSDKNPRIISDQDFEKLCNDIKNDPNFLIQRPPLLNKLGDKHYCYAGTQRIKACKRLGYKSIKCFEEENVPEEVQHKRMLKDNLHRGIWDESKIMDLGFELNELIDIGLTDIDFDLASEPNDLVSKNKENPYSIKIIFENESQLQKFEKKLNSEIKMIDDFKNIKYSVSGGEF